MGEKGSDCTWCLDLVLSRFLLLGCPHLSGATPATLPTKQVGAILPIIIRACFGMPPLGESWCEVYLICVGTFLNWFSAVPFAGFLCTAAVDFSRRASYVFSSLSLSLSASPLLSSLLPLLCLSQPTLLFLTPGTAGTWRCAAR